MCELVKFMHTVSCQQNPRCVQTFLKTFSVSPFNSLTLTVKLEDTNMTLRNLLDNKSVQGTVLLYCSRQATLCRKLLQETYQSFL